MADIALDPNTTPEEPVIIIHGTGAKDSTWWQAGSCFCNALNSKMRERGAHARCWAHLSYGFPQFHWSGQISDYSRSEAADHLRDYILKMEMSANIRKYHLIGHSHGGNVILDAIRALVREPGSSVAPLKLGSVITLGTPFLHRDTHFRSKKFINGLPILYSIFYLLFIFFMLICSSKGSYDIYYYYYNSSSSSITCRASSLLCLL